MAHGCVLFYSILFRRPRWSHTDPDTKSIYCAHRDTVPWRTPNWCYSENWPFSDTHSPRNTNLFRPFDSYTICIRAQSLGNTSICLYLKITKENWMKLLILCVEWDGPNDIRMNEQIQTNAKDRIFVYQSSQFIWIISFALWRAGSKTGPWLCGFRPNFIELSSDVLHRPGHFLVRFLMHTQLVVEWFFRSCEYTKPLYAKCKLPRRFSIKLSDSFTIHLPANDNNFFQIY